METAVPETQTLRIFISSPGDVAAEREKAKQVIAQLSNWYGASVNLVPVLWEDLPLKSNASAQEGIDLILSDEQRIDIAVFILWSRMGTELGGMITKVDGTPYRSGTEREFDLMLRAFEASDGERPDIIYYKRDDEDAFNLRLSQADDQGKLDLLQQKEQSSAFIQEMFWDEEGHNIRAYHSFQQPVEFANRLKVHLRGLIDHHLENANISPDARWTDVPYRGLESFHMEHADIFFGRETEICDLENRIRQREGEEQGCAFIAVIGASGSGKSSLVRAGLRANLIHSNFDESISEWRSLVLIPGHTNGDPLAGLVLALHQRGALPELAQSGLSQADLAQNLTESPKTGVERAIKPALQKCNPGSRVDILSAPGSRGTSVEILSANQENAAKMPPLQPGTHLLVVVDQFEELFTDKLITSEARDAFLLTLEALAQSGLCWVVITMRSDFYPVAQKSEIFLRLKGEDGQFDLLPPGPEALRRIITEPARLAGVRFEQLPPELGGQNLVAKILEDAKNQPDMLPLLSDLLLELYQMRTPENIIPFEAYESLGDETRTGLEGALSKRAEKEFAKLIPEQQATLPEILHGLVTVESDADVRRRASLEGLGDTSQRAAVVDAFIQARLLTAEGDVEKGTATVSIAHEALLRKWDRIADWVRDNRQHLRIRSRVEQSMRRWSARGNDESLLLPEGLDLEEGVSLVRDASHLLSGSEYDEVRDYIQLSRDHHQLRQKRNRRNRQIVCSLVFSLLTALAILASVLAGSAGKRYRDANYKLAKIVEGEAATALNLVDTEGKEYAKAWLSSLVPLNQKKKNLPKEAVFPESMGMLTRWDLVSGAMANLWTSPSTGAPLRSAYFSRDGKSIVSGSETGALTFWRHDSTDAPPQQLLAVTDQSGPIYTVVFSPDGEIVATGSGEDIRLWDFTEPGAPRELAPIKGPEGDAPAAVREMAFAPQGRVLAAVAEDHSIRLWDLAESAAPKDLNFGGTHDGIVYTVDFSPDGKILATGSEDKSIRLWDLSRPDSTEPIAVLNGHEDSVSSVVFSPDGRFLVSGAREVTVLIWDLSNLKNVVELSRIEKSHAESISELALSADGKTLASASYDNSIGLWDLSDLAAPKPRSMLQGHLSHAYSAAFSPDGKRLLSASEDTTIRLWDLTDPRTLQKSTGHSNFVNSIAINPDGNLLASGSRDHTARLWKVEPEKAPQEVVVLRHHKDYVYTVAISPDGTLLASGSRDHDIRIFGLSNPAAPKLLATLSGDQEGATGHSSWVLTLAFSADGKVLASGSLDKTLRLWDLADPSKPKPGAVISGFGNLVSTVAFSPRDKMLASGSYDKTVHLYDCSDVSSPTELTKMEGAWSVVSSVCFSPDGSTLAMGSGDHSIRLWDLTGGMLPRETSFFTLHEGPVTSLAFSADGKTLASASADKSIRLWDLESSGELAILRGHTESVSSVVFSRDGKTLFSGSRDHSVRSWNLAGPFAGYRAAGQESKTFQDLYKASFELLPFRLEEETKLEPKKELSEYPDPYPYRKQGIPFVKWIDKKG